jgi:hypothetical protein
MYKANFPIGSRVRIADAGQLQGLHRTWKFHDKLRTEQLNYAGGIGQVERIGYYHRGDVLYWLRGVPGILALAVP